MIILDMCIDTVRAVGYGSAVTGGTRDISGSIWTQLNVSMTTVSHVPLNIEGARDELSESVLFKRLVIVTAKVLPRLDEATIEK